MSDESNKNDALSQNPSERVARGRLSRRVFVKRSMMYGAGLTSFLASLSAKTKRTTSDEAPRRPGIHLSPDAPVEYIIVGSGAGGGPLACRLARAGHKVVLIEAGGDYPEDETPTNPSSVPIPFFSPFTNDDARISWGYYVRHFNDEAQQERDFKYQRTKNLGGLWYPRVGALGGCTIHSFLVEIYPSNSDWEHIVDVTGDTSWNPRNMRKYYQRFEECRYVPRPQGGSNPSRHGFNGWQPAEIPGYSIFSQDVNIGRIFQAAADEVGPPNVLSRLFRGKLDPNDWRQVIGKREGLYNIPQFMGNGVRKGPREFIKETAAAYPNNLIIKTHTLVTRVLFEGKTAIGVEYLEGKRLYRADPLYNDPNTPKPAPSGAPKQMRSTREVILSAGAFNTPQLLKLSGIGPTTELQQFNIPVVQNLPGVGENLQDRYEVGLVTQFNSRFTFAQSCTFGQPGDPCFADWFQGKGVYTSIGALTAILHKSKTAKRFKDPDPDLFCFSAPIRFRGYFPGYSFEDVAGFQNQGTWAILKGHTVNRSGSVRLRSADPRDTPLINFNYFPNRNLPGGDKDLEAMADGVEFIRRIVDRYADISTGPVLPGSEVTTREQIKQFVLDEAWGHHASCTCKMGPKRDPLAVVDSKFRVHGIKNLRIVDASVFPKIPGYFILTPIYMVSEKASDAILADARRHR